MFYLLFSFTEPNYMKNLFFLFLLTVLMVSCGNPPSSQSEGPSQEELLATAQEIAHEIPILDGHVDLPYRMRIAGFRLQREYVDFSGRSEDGDFDYERAKEGGLDAPFMSIYIPSEYQEIPGRPKQVADSLITMVKGIAEKFPEKFAMANSPDDVMANFDQGKISLPMGMENGAPIGDSLENVAYFHERGIRYITLTHGKDNQICDSSYDTTYTWNGLSPFGEQVVKEMNRVGIMVDVSHISDSTFYDVMELTDVPVIASHSSLRHFTPGWERNMNDDMLLKLKENGGVVQINFGSSFLDMASQDKFQQFRKEFEIWLEENGLTRFDSAAKVYAQQTLDELDAFSNVEMVANHIDHVKNLIGIDHVGLGSDYDGVGNSLPIGLKDVSDYPNLIAELLDRGYSYEDIEKVCYKNVFRVWKEVERKSS